jgi:Tfp pilus assembly protein PilW
MNAWSRNERGVTLVEITVVTVLASLVMMALVGFYINSQTTWNDASVQAIAQRDATTAIEQITAQAHRAASATLTGTATAADLHFYDQNTNEIYRVWLNPSDSTLYEHDYTVSEPDHPLVATPARSFQVTVLGDSLVAVTDLELHTARGEPVSISASAALLNRVTP